MGNLLKRQTQIPNIPETEVGYDMVFIPPNIEAQKRSRVQKLETGSATKTRHGNQECLSWVSSQFHNQPSTISYSSYQLYPHVVGALKAACLSV